MRLNTIPSAVVSANTGGVPVGREDDAATADVVVAKLKQPLSPAEKKYEIGSNRFFSGFFFGLKFGSDLLKYWSFTRKLLRF